MSSSKAPFVTGAVTPFVTGLLRVRPQFRSHFTDVLRVLRLRRGGKGVSIPCHYLPSHYFCLHDPHSPHIPPKTAKNLFMPLKLFQLRGLNPPTRKKI